MDFTLSPKQDLVGFGAVFDRQRGILIHELRERSRQLHLVLAVLRCHCERKKRSRRLWPRRVNFHGCEREELSGPRRFETTKPDHLAHSCAWFLLQIVSHYPEQPAYARS